MAAPKGNQFWKARAKHGRDKIFKTPESLKAAAEEYFQWTEDNPLWDYKPAQFQGKQVTVKIPKMRAMTITGLARFLHIDFNTWLDYKSQDDFSHIAHEIEGIIHDQKFTGAAAEQLNPNIIARDLGLRDKADVTSNGETITFNSNFGNGD